MGSRRKALGLYQRRVCASAPGPATCSIIGRHEPQRHADPQRRVDSRQCREWDFGPTASRFILTTFVRMSHHYSGPEFGSPHDDARLDFTDLYAFPKPGDKNTSVLIMDVHPSVNVKPPGPTMTRPLLS